MYKIIFQKQVHKALKKLPMHIVRNLQKWALQVEELGIEEIRKIPGYHDEPLRGDREGQRSVRLSRSYRAFYIEYWENDQARQEIINIVSVEEVSKHEY